MGCPCTSENNYVVSPKARANNFAPTIFSNSPEATPLHKSANRRKAMLQKAMDALLDAGEIHLGMGPRS